MSKDENRIAIHSVTTRTRAGFVCQKWREFIVVVGANPFGPRGGRCGNIVDGKILGRFSKWENAKEFAAKLAL